MIARFPGQCVVCGGEFVPRETEVEVHPTMRGPRGGKKMAHVECLAEGGEVLSNPAERLGRETADLEAAERELAFLLPLAGKAPQFDERIEYLRDIIAGLRGDVLLSKAEMKRHAARRNPGVKLRQNVFGLFSKPSGPLYRIEIYKGLKNTPVVETKEVRESKLRDTLFDMDMLRGSEVRKMLDAITASGSAAGITYNYFSGAPERQVVVTRVEEAAANPLRRNRLN